MGNKLSLGGGGGGTPSGGGGGLSPDDDTSVHTAADDTTNNNNVNSDRTSIDAPNIVANTQDITPSYPPKNALNNNYATSNSNINDDKSQSNYNNNIDSVTIPLPTRMVYNNNNNNNNNNSHNPEVTSTNVAVDDRLYPVAYPNASAQSIESNKSAARILENLDEDEFIDYLVDAGFERRLACEVLAEHGYGKEGCEQLDMQMIVYEIAHRDEFADRNSMMDTNNEDSKQSASVSTLISSPSNGRNGGRNKNNINDGDGIMGITDGVSKLHSPMKSPSTTSHNKKRFKQSTTAANANDYTNVYGMEIDTPAINRTATLQSLLPDVFVETALNNTGGMSAEPEPERTTNNEHIRLEEESDNPSSGSNAHGYNHHPHTLQSMLWSNTDDGSGTNNNQSQPQLIDTYGESVDINDVNYQIGNDDDIDQLVELINNLDEAEQVLGYDNPENVIQFLLNQSQDRDWIPTGIEHPFQNKNWALNRDESVQLGQGPKIGSRQQLNVAESKAFYGPYGTVRRLCPLFGYEDRSRYGKSVGKGLIAKGLEDLEVIYCPCKLCPVQVKLCRAKGGLVVYEKSSPETGLPYKHNKTCILLFVSVSQAKGYL